jgi:MoxR-like ATPase
MEARAAQAPGSEDRDVALLERLGEARAALEAEIARRVVGQHSIVEGLLTALLADGHVLLVGVPGLAKTLLISTLAEALELNFRRIQFTPDLMPSDITGTEVLEEDRATGRRMFRFVPGPIFANVVLADEINRTPPKTQAALLQAMQERAVTAAGQTMPPEAQLDRFMLELRIGYPSREEEERIAMETTGASQPQVRHALSGQELMELQKLVRRVPAAPSLVSYAVRLARATRPDDIDAPDLIKRYVSWGAGPRASQYLVLGAKARAAMGARGVPNFDDVRAVAPAVLRHRVVTNFQAEADSRTSDSVVEELIQLSRKWT